MHISTDKVLYLLYKLRHSLTRAEEHGVVNREVIKEYIRRTEKLIKHLWGLRGEYPSLNKVFIALGETSGLYTIIPSSTSGRSADYKKYKDIEKKLSSFVDKYSDKLTV